MRKLIVLSLLTLSMTANAEDVNLLVKYNCTGCHGVDGNGTPAAPKIAGLKSEYVVEQLTAFQNGTRVNPMMQPMSLAAKGHEKELGDYISGLK